MKRITLSALLMTLFLLMSCNNSASSPKDGQAAKSDGTVIDLVTITKNIKDTVAFAKSVKEVHTLVKSIDELAKGIKKKIGENGLEDDNGGKNGSLLAGAFSVAIAIEAKLLALETKTVDNELKKQVTAAKTESKKFLDKLKEKKDDLGKEDASDSDTKKAIDRKNEANGDKGVSELGKLNTAVDALLKDANAAVESAIKELTTSAKPSNT
ncbi:Vsp/OspC family lipoprotein [Borrelia turicatae]|uniref:Vsp/OspC family lipoprotein n=1 Tax=Borrelia turicatae TaxID=142 RepID=UPI002ED4FD10